MMRERYVIVWRASPGAAVVTHANPDKTPRVFLDPSGEPNGDAVDTSGEDFESLLTSRAEFSPCRVPVSLAETLLGWSLTSGAST